MTEKKDPIIEALLKMETPPLPIAFRERTIAIARTNLRLKQKERVSLLAFADAVTPAPLVPSLLVSAAVVFVVDAVSTMARFLWLS